MSNTPTPLPTRSVVICAYTIERWEQLGAAVDSALSQVADTDEVIVVIDHNSELLDRAQRSLGNSVTVVGNTGTRGLSGARNTGVGVSSRDVVVFLDDDAVAADDWLDLLTTPFANPDVVGVGGRAEPDWESGTAPWWMPEDFLWVVGCSYKGLPTEAAPVRNPIGCNMAFRRSAIEDVGGFSSDLGRVGKKPVGGEETDLSIRIAHVVGGRIMYEPAAAVAHHVNAARENWTYFASRCYFEGRSKAVLAKRVGASDATEAERTYLSTLARGVTSRIGEAIRTRRTAPLAQIGALLAGLAITTTGFAVGSASSILRRDQ